MRVIISSVPNFIDLLQRYPALTSLPAFSNLLPVLKGMHTPRVNECSACNKKFVQNNKSVFEGSLNSLSASDKDAMKRILGVSEVCYYSQRNGKLDLFCF